MREKGSILWLDPNHLVEDPENVRHDTPDLEGLADSIRRYGVLQPLGVSRHADRFHVVYGTRRRRAAIMARLEQILQDDGPIVQPVWRAIFTFHDKRVLGFRPHPTLYIFGNELALQS